MSSGLGAKVRSGRGSRGWWSGQGWFYSLSLTAFVSGHETSSFGLQAAGCGLCWEFITSAMWLISWWNRSILYHRAPASLPSSPLSENTDSPRLEMLAWFLPFGPWLGWVLWRFTLPRITKFSLRLDSFNGNHAIKSYDGLNRMYAVRKPHLSSSRKMSTRTLLTKCAAGEANY